MTGAPPLARRLLADLLGSAFLAALVIGSGVAAYTLSPSGVGLQLFENAAATAAGLFTIILMFGVGRTLQSGRLSCRRELPRHLLARRGCVHSCSSRGLRSRGSRC